MSNYSELAQKLLTLGKLKDKVPDYKELGFSVANADELIRMSIRCTPEDHSLSKAFDAKWLMLEFYTFEHRIPLISHNRHSGSKCFSANLDVSHWK